MVKKSNIEFKTPSIVTPARDKYNLYLAYQLTLKWKKPSYSLSLLESARYYHTEGKCEFVPVLNYEL
jgi:hypothetical protein